ncbi:MAG: ECF transporter S component [Clostridia bacterium]|nr:ECF transporter S component [Clostridia bacterium]
MKAKNYFSTKRLCFMATFTALVAVATMVVQIPSPGGQGYINVGDSLIFACAVFFDPLFAFIAGGLGSAFADIFAGWVSYAPFTFIIKGCEGLVACLVLRLLKKLRVKTFACYALAMFLGGLCMAVGYFFADLFVYGIGMGVANLPFNFVQAGANLVLGFALAVVLGRVKGVKKVLSLENED